jgi:c-di-GMP-binding flagellar brake protein YcgR
MPERRQYERFELFAQVELRHLSKVETFVTINISAGGLLLRNDRNIELAIGEQIRIGFDVPVLAPAFTIDATVVRVIGPTTKPGLLAAMWTSSDPAATNALAQVLWNLRKTSSD